MGTSVLLSGKTRISSTEALFYYNNSLEYQLCLVILKTQIEKNTIQMPKSNRLSNLVEFKILVSPWQL